MAAISIGGGRDAADRETRETLIEAIRQNAPGHCDRWYCACFRSAVAKVVCWLVLVGLLIATIVVVSVGWASVKAKTQSVADELASYVASSLTTSSSGGSWHATLGGDDAASYPWTISSGETSRLVGTVSVRAPSSMALDLAVAPVAAGWTPATAVIAIVVRDRVGALPPRNVTTIDLPTWSVQSSGATDVVAAATRGDAVCFAVLARTTRGLVTSTCVYF